jgi:thiosulfate/3-mercaptopyruvate sulfurtransferase
LDGGFAKWSDEEREIAAGKSTVAPVEIPALIPRDERLATADDVQDAIERGTAKIADLRSPDYYRGESKADSVKVAGHIPAACNLPANDFLSADDQTVKSWEELQALMNAGGVTDESRTITYCNTGRAGSVGYFLLRRLGNDNVSLYDGSMSEWSALGRDVDTAPANAVNSDSVE